MDLCSHIWDQLEKQLEELMEVPDPKQKSYMWAEEGQRISACSLAVDVDHF